MTTIHDVARHAGVSPVTVSRVINGARNVNIDTREKVEQAIKDLAYVPNLAARSLRSRQTFTIALIVPDITNAFWTTVARGVEDAAQGGGYSVLLCNTDENLVKQTGYINAVLQQRVDGVIIAPFDVDPINLSQLRDLRTPTVVIDRQVVGWEVDTVRSDSISGAYALVQHLIGLGHRRIALISGPPVTSTAEERVAGYSLALEDAGIPLDPQLIRRGEYRTRSGRLITDQMFEEGINPTAIMAANNVVAMGVLESLQNHGKMVPQDIALVCFDEMPELARFYPFLTVVAQPAYDMGMNAAQLLLSRINADAPLQPRNVILPSRLVLRYSCGRMLGSGSSDKVFLTPLKDRSETILIKPLGNIDQKRLSLHALNLAVLPHIHHSEGPGYELSDVNRLLNAFQNVPVDRIPHIESEISSKSIFEYVLERSLPFRQQDLSSGRASLSPADYVEFAQRIGIDAIPCEINWQPYSESSQDLAARVRQAPILTNGLLTEHFNRLEGYLRAAQGSQVGVSITFRSFFAPILEAAAAESGREDSEQRLDTLELRQERAIRAVCDRFAEDLVFITFRDDLSSLLQAQDDRLQEIFLPRLERLIRPVKEHNLLVGINTPGLSEKNLPMLERLGFNLIQSINHEKFDLYRLRDQWKDRLIFMGCFPLHLFSNREEVEKQVRLHCEALIKGGGFIFGASQPVTEQIRPEVFLAMARTAHRYGVYSSSDELPSQ